MAAIQLAKQAGATVHLDRVERREARTTHGSSGSIMGSTTQRENFVERCAS